MRFERRTGRCTVVKRRVEIYILQTSAVFSFTYDTHEISSNYRVKARKVEQIDKDIGDKERERNLRKNNTEKVVTVKRDKINVEGHD